MDCLPIPMRPLAIIIILALLLAGCMGSPPSDHECPDAHDPRVDHDLDGVPDLADVDPWEDILVWLNWSYQTNSSDYVNIVLRIDGNQWDHVVRPGPINISSANAYDWPDDRTNLSVRLDANGENQTGNITWTVMSLSWIVGGVDFEMEVGTRG